MQDDKLLTQYARDGSQSAFSQLVARHLALVYATCLRETGSPTQAEDAAQVVFLLLARKAKSLRAAPSLAGWLYQTARFVAKDVRKQEARRQRREQSIVQETTHHQETTTDPEWEQVEPMLNAALSALKPQEREAVLLRLLEGHTLAETGMALGLTEDAARMRVTRAVEKMRRYLTAQGMPVTGAVLAALLTSEAVRPVPAHAADTITQGTLTAITAGPTPSVLLLSKGVSHTMTLIKLKYAALAAGLLLAGATVPPLAHALAPPKISVKASTSPVPLAENATTKFTLDKDQHAYYSVDLPKGDFLVVLDSRRADGKSGDGKSTSLKWQLNFHNADAPLPSNTTDRVGVQFSSSEDEERIVNHRSLNTAMPLILDIGNDGVHSEYWITILPAVDNKSEASPALAIPLFGEIIPPTIAVGEMMTGQLKQNKSTYFLVKLQAGQYQSILNFSGTDRKSTELNGILSRSTENGNEGGFGATINNLHWNDSAQYRNVSTFTVDPGGMGAAPSGLSLIKVYNEGSVSDAAPVHFTARILRATVAETSPAPPSSTSYHLDEIRITGNKTVPTKAIMSALGFHVGDTESDKQLQQAMTRVYLLQWFDVAGPFLFEVKSDSGFLLTLPVQEKTNLTGIKPEEFQEQAEIGNAYDAGEDALHDHHLDQFAAMVAPSFQAVGEAGQPETLNQYLAQIEGPLGSSALIETNHYITGSHHSGNLVVVSTKLTWYRWTRLPGSPYTGCEELEQLVEDNWLQSSKGWILETRRATTEAQKTDNPANYIRGLRARGFR